MNADRDIEKTYSLTEFVAELRRLADALEAGETFTVEIEGEEVSVPADVVFSVEHEREDGREELEFQLVWDTGDDEDDDEDEDGEDDEEDDAEADDEEEEDEDA